jgi:hypothetical protein
MFLYHDALHFSKTGSVMETSDLTARQIFDSSRKTPAVPALALAKKPSW